MWLNNLQVWYRNLVGKSEKKEENISYEKEEDDYEAPIKEKNEDKLPGKVKMNGGDHGNVMGLNRKLLGFLLGFGFLLIAVMYGYMIQDNSAREAEKKEKAAVNTEDTAANVSSKNKELGYSDVYPPDRQGLAGANSRFVNKRNPNNEKTGTDTQDPLGIGATNNGNTQNAGQPQETQTPVVSSAPVVATPTLPQIPSHNYSTPATIPTPVASQNTNQETEAQRAETERKRQLAERYKSSISFGLSSGGNNNLAQSGNNSSGGTNSQGSNGKTLASTSQSAFPSSPIQYMAASDGVLQAGTLIPAVLFSGINTNVAGQVTAQTMSDVYDTATGTNLLIPAGSQLIGSYEAGTSSGNNRVNVAFSMLVLPDGASYAIDNSMVAVDGAGYNGIAGKIDHHTDQALRNGLLTSAFTAISSKWTDRVYLDMSNIADIAKMEGVRPTITINPGKEFNLFVTKPIIFAQ